MSPEAAASRGGFGEERYETLAMQKAVRDQFEALRDSSWTVIDASQDVQTIHTQVMDVAYAAVKACASGGQPIKTLWDGAPVAR